ncbi:MAG: zinc ribbon domain-containing protein [Dehalococcoidia bacterium]|nr:zinc ribbon domain-containing protein [Dehalococcoidia bacterium]
MPRYDYRCLSCDGEFELVQSFAEAGTGVCPECSGAGRRLFHAVPVIYKGSGFYTTDYGRPKPPLENGSKESSAKPSDSGVGSSSGKDSKATAKESSSDGAAASSSSSAKAGSDTKAST